MSGIHEGRVGLHHSSRRNSIAEIFSVICEKPLSHVQLACNSSHFALPCQGKNLLIYNITDLYNKPPLQLVGHHGDVSAIVYGTGIAPLLLCSASEDYVIVWDIDSCYRKAREGAVPSGTVVGTRLGKVVHLSMCPTDRRVAVSSGSKIYVLKTEKEEVLAMLTGHLGPLTASEFCPWDPGMLVSISEDRTFKIWNVAKAEVLFQSAVLSGSPLLSIVLLDQSRQLVTGSADGQVWSYTLPDDQKCHLVAKLDLHKVQQKYDKNLNGRDPPTGGATDSYVWIGSSDGLYLIDLATSELEMALPLRDSPHLSFSVSGSWAPSQGQNNKMHCLVTSLFEPRVALLDVDVITLGNLCSYWETALSGLESLSVVPSSPLMPISPLNAELPKRDTKALKKTGQSSQGGVKDQALVFHTQVKSSGYTVPPRSTMFTPKTNTKKKSSTPSKTSKNTGSLIIEYPSDSAAPSVPHIQQSVSTLPTPIHSLQYSGDGKQILCGLGDRSVLLYKSSLAGHPAVYTGHNKAVSTVCWSHCRRWFLSVADDQTLFIWPTVGSEPALTMGTEKCSKSVRLAQFYYLDKFLLLASGSSLHLYLHHMDTSRDDIKRYEQKSMSKLTQSLSMRSGTDITALSAINDFFSYIVLACGADRSIQVFDMNRGCIAAEISDAHTRAVHHITQNKGSMFSTQTPDSYNLFLSSAVSDGVKLWDLRTARCVRRFGSSLNRCHRCSAAMSPCGQYIATGSEDYCAYVYDIRSSTFVHKLKRQSDTVLNVAFNPATPELLPEL
ncbi:WD repeat-containing protein 27 [Chanos chanos]|uniref:WD repeat-containing protein 27 n=1 Tax=Chanos chanos TaxID=29144 RepID=A0A6J2V8H6_CHACN|nr:WD repeat-containing protein 27 [Chanos chanos]